MKEKNIRIKGLVILLVIVLFSFPISYLFPINTSNDSNDSNNIEEIPPSEEIPNLASDTLATDNTFTGIGSPWNVTHYANRTKTNLEISFNNNSYDNSQYVELDGWMGYQLNSTITNLYDTRNWINGTFHCGPDDNDYSRDDNDSNYVANWTFKTMDTLDTNYMSGNYFDDGYSGSDGADCLQLLIGDYSNNYYDVGDKCWWETIFEIDRGDVDEAWLSFAVFPKYSDIYNNHFVLQVIVNNKILWGNGLASMLEACGNPSTGQWYNPPTIYLDVNDGQLFPVGVKDMNVTLEFKRVSGNPYSGYAEDYSVLIDNVSLIVKAKAKPSQLDLQLNNEDVIDNGNYGKGYVGILGNWNGSIQSSVIANFSSNLNWPLTFEEDGSWISYKIELETNLNLFTNKFSPETYYTADPNLNYQGSSFIVSNNSNVNWTTYAHMEIPTGYEETNMTVEYPSDFNLTGVFFSLNPDSLSQTSIKEHGNKKIVNIPVSSITSNTNGFWRLTAVSPNYCKEMEIYNNVTGDWELNNEFLSGEYINITGKIYNSALVSGYIQQTKAQLQIRFPDSSIWTSKTQIKLVDSTGTVYFDPIMIPDNIPNYKAGEYEAVITWNNSYSSFGSNETGIIYKKFIVIHDSLLYPDEGVYFIENVIDDRIINIKVSFRDLIDGTAIENAYVYTDFTGVDESLIQTSPGFYLYEFNASKAEAGNNTVTIYANSSYYLNKTINITVDVIKETILTVETDFFTTPWKQNFTVRFNYTEKNNPLNWIDTTDITIDEWLGDYHLTQPSVGHYELECNTSAYASLTLQSFIISIDPYKYEPQSVLIRVQITELASSLKLLLNGNETSNNGKITVELDAVINVTITFSDQLTGKHLPNATVSLLPDRYFDETNEYYNYSLKANTLAQEVTLLTVFAEVVNYQPQTINFFIEVTKKSSQLQLFLDGIDKTSDPVYELPIKEFLNITVKFMDNESQHISNATIQLEGESLTFNLTEDAGLGQYYIPGGLDTTILGIGTKLFTIIAYAPNYIIKTIGGIRITINKIVGIISRADGGDQIEVDVGEDVLLKIILKDPLNNTIKNANVTFTWAYGQGELEDLDNDGIYNVTLFNVREGVHEIKIYAVYGDDYIFQEYKITLIVSRPSVSPGPNLSWLISLLVYGFIGVILVVGTIFTLYIKRWRFPPLVRKIRALRKKVSKAKKTKPVIVNKREEIIKNNLQDSVKILSLELIQPEKINKIEKINLKKEEVN